MVILFRILKMSSQLMRFTFILKIYNSKIPFLKACDISYCSVCRLDQKVRKVTVRGLCSLSLFESNYIATMSQNGTFIFLGSISSSIRFNKENDQWEWFDQKQIGSMATRKLLSLKLKLNSIR